MSLSSYANGESTRVANPNRIEGKVLKHAGSRYCCNAALLNAWHFAEDEAWGLTF